jgi:hypothetical protein
VFYEIVQLQRNDAFAQQPTFDELSSADQARLRAPSAAWLPSTRWTIGHRYPVVVVKAG